MKTVEFAKKYNVKSEWVSARCKDGMILLAEKKLVWEIDETATLPPCTAKRAIMILENILECKKGNKVYIIQEDNKKQDMATLKYLEYWGFITIIEDVDNLNNVNITDRGINLIKKNNDKKKYDNLLLLLKGAIELGKIKYSQKKTKK